MLSLLVALALAAQKARAMAATTHRELQKLETRIGKIEQTCPLCRGQLTT